MKEFKKWWKKTYGQGSTRAIIAGEESWRAALECVLNNMACKNGILQDDSVIRNRIREELGDA